MILSPPELRILSPMLALLHVNSDFCLRLIIDVPGGRHITVDLSAACVYVKAKYPESPPAAEFYRLPMGLAQAYGCKQLQVLLGGE